MVDVGANECDNTINGRNQFVLFVLVHLLLIGLNGTNGKYGIFSTYLKLTCKSHNKSWVVVLKSLFIFSVRYLKYTFETKGFISTLRNKVLKNCVAHILSESVVSVPSLYRTSLKYIIFLIINKVKKEINKSTL